MTINEIIEKVKNYHPIITDYDKNPVACDGVKYGNIDQICTGIAVAIGADIDVIRRAGELNCNLLFIHEPTFYTHMDSTEWLAEDDVYRMKTELIQKINGLIRDHIVIVITHDPVFDVYKHDCDSLQLEKSF